MIIRSVQQYLVVFLFLSFSLLFAEEDRVEHFSWRSHIVDEHGQPVPYANVVVNELNRGTVSDETGHVRLDHLPSGDFEVNISVIGYVMKSVRIVIPQPPGEVTRVVLEHTILEGSVVTVSVTGLPTDVLHSERTVSVLEGENLQRHAGQSLSSTIGNIAGVQVVSQGHAITKPIIRGMSNQRIVILKDGIRMEGQQWGGHHTPEADVLSVGRIEVVRGPMGLIYGSDALGGVVHLESPALQTLDEGGQKFQLASRAGFHANSQQLIGGFGIQKAGQTTAMHVNFQGRWSDDYAAPGDDEFLSRVPGTAFQQQSASLHWAKKFHSSKLELLGGYYQEEQTLIGEGHWHNTGGGPEGTDSWFHVLGKIISPTVNDNLTIKGKWMLEHSWLEYDAGVQHNHREGGVENETPAVDITTDTYSANIRWRHIVQDKLPGTIGLSYMNKLSHSIGQERLLPNYNLLALGAYSYYRWKWWDLTFSGGLRVDAHTYDIQTSTFPMINVSEDVSRNYFPVTSGGVGLVWHRVEAPYSLALNIGTGWRPPNPYELYINGVHHGDWKIERGDAVLAAESSINTDLILRHVAGSHSGEFTFFYNHLTDYITSAPTGTRDDQTGIPVYQITQGNARTYGSEMRLEHTVGGHMRANVGWDIMWGEYLEATIDADQDGKVETNLPAINPPRILSGLSFELDKLSIFRKISLELSGEYYFPQENLAEYENMIDDGDGGILFVEPEGYTLLNLAAHAKLPFGTSFLDMSMGVDNVLNAQYYSHLSRYKGLVYDQGINLYGEIRIKI
ncbi:MAG: TonB-dependent receptor [Candidatus Marinimicrobia bacterium]|nr:TonB-dependent receptor [Candidatus Neomarinimicrobiota bacterium]MCF7850254.1 TonB-dependent receptor [Candidatus Neomarinimicrobiota bacterium]MCF7903849.1 TonB-dependent receptor [Candidatus Neomarinimicrobiota bacterium]